MRLFQLTILALLFISLSGCAADDSALGTTNNNSGYDTNNLNNYNNNGANGANNSQDPAPPVEVGPENWPPDECVESGPTTLYLSADDSNSQASPAFIAREILAGSYIRPEWVRPWEFLNYASFAYAPPTEGLALYPELSETETSGLYTMQIGVRSVDRAHEAVRPLNLVVILDSSGSMAGEAIELEKQSLAVLLGTLRAVDRVTLVRMNAYTTLLTENSAPDEIDLEAIFGELRPNGVTDLAAALSTAYEKASLYYSPEKMNRVVLFTDGAATAGETDLETIRELAGAPTQEGIHLMAVGLGEAFNDTLLDHLTDAGKGAYIFIDSVEEAQRQLGDNFVSNFDVAALNVQVKMVLPPTFSVLTFYGEQISQNPAEVTPQNLAPGDQMIFNQVIGTCDPASATGEEPFTIVVTWTDALTQESGTATSIVTLGSLLEQASPNLAKGNALVGFADSLSALHELIGGAHQDEINAICDAQAALFEAAPEDDEIAWAAALMQSYCLTVALGERHEGSCDGEPGASFTQALGICDPAVTAIPGAMAQGSEGIRWGAFERLYESSAITPREGYRFAALSTGRVGEELTIPGLAGNATFNDPQPRFSGEVAITPSQANVYDLTTVSITLTAPTDARSFSFDFDFLSAEYPNYIGSEYNDTFYAILEAQSTNDGAPTNISFDALGHAMEINNNYFDNPYHPCSERNSGFVNRASTCWLRTSWPIAPGETFTITFTIHDEGDAIYSSTALLDNFKFHTHDAVGMTDPL